MSLEEELQKQVEELRRQLAQQSQGDPSVCGVSVKLATFWHDKPVLWFAQAEAQFELAGITQDSTKYGHLLSVLDSRLADEVEDIITHPPKENKYENLKSELIKRFSTSKKERVRQLLCQEVIGDRKPSSFLRHLRALAGKTDGDDSIVRELWTRSLPPEVQRILIAQLDLPIDKVAEIADAMVDVPPAPPAPPTVSVNAATSVDLEKIMRSVDELAKKVEALSNDRLRSRSNSRSRSRSRNSSRSPPRSGPRMCWYHKRWGKDANRCLTPCTWKPDHQGNPPSNQK